MPTVLVICLLQEEEQEFRCAWVNDESLLHRPTAEASRIQVL
jgi:hypothetical protein